ncbi:N-acetylglucosamine-6-phosphate deacetylase [Frondihabitans sp. 762G35]|uniref:N-acetylglucosamine-6-phosphate deacetylase n=1 Tax=Frondihabitans sp. 762G35 TaxID=1446794 RepID=UPI000D211E52|nr:N-acetylglucosamine-6-phosphate deacetylase [Frondihabitans sp. 762G35]ARC55856.1 N-acetylglucosamine-6-phosphate deacetylase [Frondihabitans sp. 762G35]
MTTLVTHAVALDATGDSLGAWLLLDDDTIVATGTGRAPADEVETAEEIVDVGGAVVTPGLIDLHGHGGGGHSFDGSADEIREALAFHRAHGTTRSVVSLVAGPLNRLGASLEQIRRVADRDPLVLGAHLEGPFLSPDNRGAHDPHFLAAPTPENVEALIEAGTGILRVVTLAPELPGALEAVERFVAAGVTVAVGHTVATAEDAALAFDRGATLLTHAFNAMPGIHHRAPGPVVAAVEDRRVTLELILDGVHVHPSVAALLMREAPDRVALITDAMAAAGAADGDYVLGSLDVRVDGGVARLRGSDTIAGSTLTQDAALRFAIDRAGISPRDAVAALTRTPAIALGLGDRLGLLAPGHAADLVVWNDDWTVRSVWGAGRRLAV